MVGYVGNVKTRPLTILGVRLKAEQPELTEEQKDEVIHITGENLYNNTRKCRSRTGGIV